MRGYTVAAAAVTLGMPAKQLDNILSHHSVPGVQRSRQGVQRLVAPSALIQLEIAVILADTLGMPFTLAIPLAAQIHRAGGTIDIADTPRLSLRLDLPSLTAQLDRRLADAVESAPHPKRGRPRRSKATG